MRWALPTLPALSLTQRLAVFFTLVASAVVLGLGLLFVVAADRHFLDLDRQALEDKQGLIEAIVHGANASEDIRWRLSEALGHHHGLHAVVTGDQGGTLYASTPFTPPPDSALRPVDFGDGKRLWAWSQGDVDFLALRFQTQPRTTPPQGPLRVLLALDTQHHRHFLQGLQRSVALYAVVAMLVSGLLGWLAAHQGMKPLRTMKARAAAVTAHRLEARMPVEAVPAEMADLARELNGMLARLQGDFQRLSEFSSDLAHELRTPISNLLTQTQVTLSHKRSPDDYRHALASNSEELQRLARTVSDMLLLAKTEHGLALPNLDTMDLADEADALLAFYEALAADRQLSLHRQGQGRIRGDRLMVRRALSNLLSNAIRHAPAGSQVVVHVSEHSAGTEVAVDNAGPPIAPEVLARLFDRFYRADPARAHPGTDGAGLGLAITRATVLAHGGSVGATSAQGRNRFWLRFPAP